MSFDCWEPDSKRGRDGHPNGCKQVRRETACSNTDRTHCEDAISNARQPVNSLPPEVLEEVKRLLRLEDQVSFRRVQRSNEGLEVECDDAFYFSGPPARHCEGPDGSLKCREKGKTILYRDVYCRPDVLEKHQRARFTNQTLRSAVDLHLRDKNRADEIFGPIGTWDVTAVTDMSGLFRGAHHFNEDISKWEFPKVTDMSHFFFGAERFNGDISKWRFPEVTNMSHFFFGADNFSGDISKWKFPKVTDMSFFFSRAWSFNGDISKWEFPEVTDMSDFFSSAYRFDGDISKWEFPQVTDMGGFFRDAWSFRGDISDWKFPKVTDMSHFFFGADNFDGDISKWEFPQVTDMEGFFRGAWSFRGDISDWKFPKVTDMSVLAVLTVTSAIGSSPKSPT